MLSFHESNIHFHFREMISKLCHKKLLFDRIYVVSWGAKECRPLLHPRPPWLSHAEVRPLSLRSPWRAPTPRLSALPNARTMWSTWPSTSGPRWTTWCTPSSCCSAQNWCRAPFGRASRISGCTVACMLPKYISHLALNNHDSIIVMKHDFLFIILLHVPLPQIYVHSLLCLESEICLHFQILCCALSSWHPRPLSCAPFVG